VLITVMFVSGLQHGVLFIEAVRPYTGSTYIYRRRKNVFVITIHDTIVQWISRIQSCSIIRLRLPVFKRIHLHLYLPNLTE